MLSVPSAGSVRLKSVVASWSQNANIPYEGGKVAPRNPRAKVTWGGRWEPGSLADVLGELPHDVHPVLSPILTVDGLVEEDATAWLAYVCARTGGTKTAKTYAESLCVYASFLLGRNCSLRGATRDHVVEYVNYRTVDEDTRVSGTTWYKDRTVIRGFHEWLRDTHGIELPFTLDVVPTPTGPKLSMREGRNVARKSADGTPLTPSLVSELLAAAWRAGSDGRTSATSRTGARDAAFISLGLACGARAFTLTHLTIYELPNLSSPGDLIEMWLPGSIMKRGREVVLPAFRHHLQRVQDYTRGARRMLLQDWKPRDPIYVAEPPTPGFRGIVDTNGIQRPFNNMKAEERRRLLTEDGEPALLFLSTTDGAPVKYRTAQEFTSDVSLLAEVNAFSKGRVFPHVHTHDLRHTYSTHLAALFILGVPTSAARDMHGRPHRVDIRSAVQMASMALGHANEATTSLYIRQVGMMILRYGIDDFLGRT